MNRQQRRANNDTAIRAISTYELYKLRKTERENARKELIAEYGDQAAIAIAKDEGYITGFSEGAKYSENHYLNLAYLCMAFALHDAHGFGQKRIIAVWQKLSEYYSEANRRMDEEEGITLEQIEEDLNNLLDEKIGMKLDLKRSDDVGTE